MHVKMVFFSFWVMHYFLNGLKGIAASLKIVTIVVIVKLNHIIVSLNYILIK